MKNKHERQMEFISKITTLLNNKESSIKKCYLILGNNFSSRGIPENAVSLIVHINREYNSKLALRLDRGLDNVKEQIKDFDGNDDINELFDLLYEYLPINRYEGLLFFATLFEINKSIEDVFIFKYELDANNEITINGEIYIRNYYQVNRNSFLLKKINKDGYHQISFYKMPKKCSSKEQMQKIIKEFSDLDQYRSIYVFLEVYEPVFSGEFLCANAWYYKGDFLSTDIGELIND